MADEKWQKVREVFDDALRRQPEERRKFVHAACGENKTLLAEVESLLASLDSADSFMETPAVAKVASVFEAETKKLERGKCFGHYEIIEQIGAGGMGEIYLAKDKKLDRQVAVKILNEQFSRHESNLNRFIQEAKAASALNHPNILTIYEFGEAEDAHFIVSEFINGKTLREIFMQETLKLSQVLNISIQIAGALCTAHEANIVHRDIKPENIMLRPDGLVKILDFGLAKLIQPKQALAGLKDENAKQNDTAKGIILGTVNYMSPEQAKGERVDERTDIFSFGAVIYEMIAGHTPFAGDSVVDTLANLINSEPPPLAHYAGAVPDKLQEIVAKTLRKNADKRYQTMKDLFADVQDLRENLSLEEKFERSAASENGNAAALLPATTGNSNKETAETQNTFSQRIKRHKPLAAFACAALLVGAIALSYYFFYAGKTASSVGDKKSIAVLPVQPINTANRDEIYEIGIADSLIYKLSSMKGFVVRPLSATRKYADIAQDPLAAGKEQQVDYVLASNYQLAGGKIRITAQLFNVASGQIEETKIIEKDAGNVFAMQDAVAGEVGNILAARFVNISGSPKAVRGTANEEAYRLYLLAKNLTARRLAADVHKAADYFEQVIRLDPNFAQAYSGLAHAYILLGQWDGMPRERYEKAQNAVNKALELDNNLAEGYAVRGKLKFSFNWDFAGAEKDLATAAELEPNSMLGLLFRAEYLNNSGRFDEAVAAVETAMEIDPNSLALQQARGRFLYYARRYDEAILQLNRLIEVDENYVNAYGTLHVAYEKKGDYARAFDNFMKFVKRTAPDQIETYQQIYKTAGLRGVELKFVEFGKLKGSSLNGNSGASNYGLAMLSALAGEKEQAFELLNNAIEHRPAQMTMLNVEPAFDSLRDDPRFDELVRRVGLK